MEVLKKFPETQRCSELRICSHHFVSSSGSSGAWWKVMLRNGYTTFSFSGSGEARPQNLKPFKALDKTTEEPSPAKLVGGGRRPCPGLSQLPRL